MFHMPAYRWGTHGAPAGLPLGAPIGGETGSYGRKKTPTVLGGPSGSWRGRLGNVYMYPRRAYNPIVGADFGFVNTSGVL